MALSRCKHCGGEAALQEETNIIQNYYGISCWQVKCKTCGIRTGYGKRKEVIDSWNAVPPIKTNHDLIKSLAIAELAKFLSYTPCATTREDECVTYKTCTECYEHWLIKEAKTDA